MHNSNGTRSCRRGKNSLCMQEKVLLYLTPYYNGHCYCKNNPIKNQCQHGKACKKVGYT